MSQGRRRRRRSNNRKRRITVDSKRGIVAEAVTFALYWRFNTTKNQEACQVNRTLLSKNGTPQAMILPSGIIMLNESWGHSPPEWLMRKAYEFIRSNQGTTKNAERQIRQIIRQSFRRARRRIATRQRKQLVSA